LIGQKCWKKVIKDGRFRWGWENMASNLNAEPRRLKEGVVLEVDTKTGEKNKKWGKYETRRKRVVEKKKNTSHLRAEKNPSAEFP